MLFPALEVDAWKIKITWSRFDKKNFVQEAPEVDLRAPEVEFFVKTQGAEE